MKGVIIAAGYGTRFLPATKTVPKELFPLIDKPAIAFIVEEFIAAGIKDILIVSSRRKKSLEDYFDREVELESLFQKENNRNKLEKIDTPKANFYFTRQKEMRGTGDALLLAESFAAGEPICVAYPDDLVFSEVPLAKQLIDSLDNDEQAILGVMRVPKNETDRYGIAETSTDNKVTKITEKPPLGSVNSNLAMIGRYILPASIYPLLREEQQKNPTGEFYQIDPVNTLAATGNVKAVPFEGKRLDVGEPFGYIKAIIEYGLMQEEYKEKLLTYMQSLLSK